MTQLTVSTLLRGGLDLVTPRIAVAPGVALDALNYEPDQRGYRRIGGHERLDGQSKPHEATYHLIHFDQMSVEMLADNRIEGATSGANARLVLDPIILYGTVAGGDAVGYLVVTDLTGTFTYHETLNLVLEGVMQSDAFQTTAFQISQTTAAARFTLYEGANTASANYETYWQAAVEGTRDLITKVPGSGPVRGCCVHRGKYYAIRDTADGSAGKLYQGSISGWNELDLGHTLDFDAGTAVFAVGETLTGGTSGATATIRRIATLSGSFSANSAAGFLVLANVTGTFQDNELVTTSGGGSASANGTTAAITLPPGGRYEFSKTNFYGTAGGHRIYGAGGVGRAFEIDNTTLMPIRTGLAEAIDKPNHVAAFANHLFLGFEAGSVIFSALGDPVIYDTSQGAGEIGFGTGVTGLLEGSSTALVMFGRNKVGALTGTSKANFSLDEITSNAGAIEWTAANVGSPMYLDEGGVRRMETTAAFGNWRTGTVTQLVEPWITAKNAQGVDPVGVVRLQRRDQYRLYFEDGSGLFIYVGREQPEVMPFVTPYTVSCTDEGEDADGNEVVLVGTTDGWVYELDVGTSADGQPITSSITLSYDPLSAPTQNKRFIKGTMEIDGEAGTQLTVSATFDYGNPSTPTLAAKTITVNSYGLAEIYLNGFGRNCSLTIESTSTWAEPHVLAAATFNFTPRGVVR